MLRGLPTFLAICVLAAMPLVSRTLGQVAVGVLFALWLLTLTSVKRVTTPERRGVKGGSA